GRTIASGPHEHPRGAARAPRHRSGLHRPGDPSRRGRAPRRDPGDRHLQGRQAGGPEAPATLGRARVLDAAHAGGRRRGRSLLPRAGPAARGGGPVREHFITGGDMADFALVFAVTDPELRARGGITAFFVDRDTPGYEVTRIQRTMSPFQNPVEITFSDCEVPAENVLGEVGKGF